MKYRTEHGHFWDPEHPDRKIPGEFRFDEDGVSLTLFDALREFVFPEHEVVDGTPKWVTIPVIHGELHGATREAVSLLASTGLDLAGPYGEVTETYRGQVAVLGGHVAADLFEWCACQFDALPAWVNPPPTTDLREGEATVRTKTLALDSVTIDGVEVTLVAAPHVSLQPVAGDFSVTQTIEFRLVGPATAVRELVDTRIRSLHNLLTVAVGLPIRLTKLEVAETRDTPLRLEVLFASTQAARSRELLPSTARNYDSSMLAGHEDLPLSLLTKWAVQEDEDDDCIMLLCSPFFAPFMYVENKYANTYQSAESMAADRHGGREMDRAAHRERMARIEDALTQAGISDDEIARVKRLTNRNDKTQVQLLTEWIESCGDVGEAVLAAVPNFAQLAASARVSVSHGGAARFDSLTKHWLTEVLRFLVRYRLLLEMGVAEDHLTRRIVKNPQFTRPLKELAVLGASVLATDSGAVEPE